MHRYIIHMVICITKCGCFPFWECRHIQIRTSAGNQFNRRIYQFHGLGRFLCQTTIFMHVFMTNLPVAIHLISQAPYFYIMWIFYTMADSHITVFRSTRMIAIFEQIAGIRHTSGSQIHCHHHFRICFFQPFGKFI